MDANALSFMRCSIAGHMGVSACIQSLEGLRLWGMGVMGVTHDGASAGSSVFVRFWEASRKKCFLFRAMISEKLARLHGF